MVRPTKVPPKKLVQPSKNDNTVKKELKKYPPNMKRKTQVKALKEIKYLTRTWHLLIPKACFLRMVRSTILRVSPNSMGIRIQRFALDALQEACEMYMTQLFEDCQLASIHAKRVTVKVDDMRIVRRLRGRGDVCGHRVIYK